MPIRKFADQLPPPARNSTTGKEAARLFHPFHSSSLFILSVFEISFIQSICLELADILSRDAPHWNVRKPRGEALKAQLSTLANAENRKPAYYLHCIDAMLNYFQDTQYKQTYYDEMLCDEYVRRFGREEMHDAEKEIVIPGGWFEEGVADTTVAEKTVIGEEDGDESGEKTVEPVYRCFVCFKCSISATEK